MGGDQHQFTERPGILDALLDLCALDDLPRTGWILRGIATPESVAGHILGVAHVALALGPCARPPLDMGRVLAMALVHDAPEARSGDIPRPAGEQLPGGAKPSMEAALAAEVVNPLSGLARNAFEEYEASNTREARFVKACDILQLGVRLLRYETAGHRGLNEFWKTLASADLSEFQACAELRSTIEAAR